MRLGFVFIFNWFMVQRYNEKKGKNWMLTFLDILYRVTIYLLIFKENSVFKQNLVTIFLFTIQAVVRNKI